MEIVCKPIKRLRSSGFHTRHDFKTFAPFLRENAFEGRGYHDNFMQLVRYIRWAFINPFVDRPSSPSGSDEIIVDVKHFDAHEFIELAEKSGAAGRGKWQHQTAQDYFMQNHPMCLATELPIYDDESSGFIDIVLACPNTGHVWIPDYKPNAKAEKKAAAQVLSYLQMIKKTIKIPLKDITGSYFDHQNLYQLKI